MSPRPRPTCADARAPRFRHVTVGHVLASILLALIVASAGPIATSSAELIVSMGDSYSSGEGAGDYDGETANPLNECHRSTHAWPRKLGVQKGHHTACSGAKLTHLTKGKWRVGDNRGQLE